MLFKGDRPLAEISPAGWHLGAGARQLDVYEQRGEYQLIVERLEPQGAGALQLAFDQLKRKLEAEGLFDTERKRTLPKFPQPDRHSDLARRSGHPGYSACPRAPFPGLHVRLFPAQVQGEGAVEQVCRGIEYFSASTGPT